MLDFLVMKLDDAFGARLERLMRLLQRADSMFVFFCFGAEINESHSENAQSDGNTSLVRDVCSAMDVFYIFNFYFKNKNCNINK